MLLEVIRENKRKSSRFRTCGTHRHVNYNNSNLHDPNEV